MSIGYMKELRQRRGLGEDDTSHDEEIQALTPIERVRMLCGWHLGDEMWADVFLGWMRSQGLELRLTDDKGKKDENHS